MRLVQALSDPNPQIIPSVSPERKDDFGSSSLPPPPPALPDLPIGSPPDDTAEYSTT